MKNKTLIVVGMHRSGTSLITNWLHSCGLEVGESLLGPGLGNDEGHYEDAEFYKMHMEILKDHNLHDSGLLVNPAPPLTEYHKEKIKGIIRVKEASFEQWAWKDPRTCLFLDFYRSILPDAYYLIAFRDFQSVVISLLKRSFAEKDIIYNTKKGALSRLAWYKTRRKKHLQKHYHQNAAFFLRVWCFYNQLILNSINLLQPGNFLVINFQMLHTQEDKVIDHLTNDWHFKLNPVKFSTIYNEGLISKHFDVEQYIGDKDLISNAHNIMAQLEAYAYSAVHTTAG
jgi:hypothetical protein